MEGGRDQGDIFEAHAVVAFVNGALDVGEGEELCPGAARGIVGVCVRAVKGTKESIDTGGVAGELGEVFEAVHHAAAGVCE